MPLPRVDSVDVVIKAPEPEKGRERVRRSGESSRGQQERPAQRAPLQPAAEEPEQAQGDDSQPAAGEARTARGGDNPSRDCGADDRADDSEHHIDYRA